LWHDILDLQQTFSLSHEQVVVMQSKLFLLFDERLHLWSLSSTFYVRIFCMKVLFAAFFYLHVTREKLPKRLSYEKGAHKMLLKLTTGGNLCEKYN